MKAVHFKEVNIVVAENQKEYENIPSCYDTQTGILTFCMELNELELELAYNGKAAIAFQTAGKPHYPIRISVTKPKFPLRFDSVDFSVQCSIYENKAHHAIKSERLIAKAAKKGVVLRGTKCIWVSIQTYGHPIQPINPSLVGMLQ